MQTAKEIIADIARELREFPEHLAKGAFGLAADGTLVPAASSTAVCWCLAGHVQKRTPTRVDGFLTPSCAKVRSEAILKLTGALPDPWVSFIHYNDFPDITVGDVIALCERAAA